VEEWGSPTNRILIPVTNAVDVKESGWGGFHGVMHMLFFVSSEEYARDDKHSEGIKG